jgi:nifR3 family TIM-barrel protein
MRIGDHLVEHGIVLAPMAGVTDAPFRVLCAEQGGGVFVSEMLTARGLVEGGDKSWAMARHHPAETYRSIQLYGSDPAAMGEAARRLVTEVPIDHIDLNFGCPVPKVTRNGGGAALPVRRRLYGEVVAAAVRGAGNVPVTVKMRMGLDDERLTFLDAAAVAADAGAAAVALHARTARQGYSGVARWEAIAALRDALPHDVPVLGNGDVWEASDALEMLATTGCDGVVIGRGCLGRPWLFADLARVMQGEEAVGPPPLGVVAGHVRRHVELSVDWYDDEAQAVRKLRKHLRWYLQGYAVGAEVRRRAGRVTTAVEVERLLDELDPDLTVLPEAVRAPRGRTDAISRLVLPEGWMEHPDAMTPVAEPAGFISGG